MVFGVVLLKRGDITLQQWIAFFMFSSTLSTSFDNLINYWMNLKMIQGTLARTAHLLMAPEEEDTVKDTKKPESTDIVFENVSFAYGDKKALKNISFQVPAGSSSSVISQTGTPPNVTLPSLGS